MVRIRSEHAIGFLKGRFHSLKNLRVRIKDKKSHKFATYWVAACIGIHVFAMMCEDEEREEDPDQDFVDPFIAEGLSSSDSEDDSNVRASHPGPASGRRLQQGKAKREKLKRALFRAKERRTRQRERRRQEEDMGDE
jgi:hypothetical protein